MSQVSIGIRAILSRNILLIQVQRIEELLISECNVVKSLWVAVGLSGKIQEDSPEVSHIILVIALLESLLKEFEDGLIFVFDQILVSASEGREFSKEVLVRFEVLKIVSEELEGSVNV
eukprot:TRINITY_DN6441_c0_g1_i6.p2 TRINITY_DN6441_c0_g1~~TRINITY_DN6441_c0_g1_i6.p2  ORF type:complete len:118 (-),score=13.33 TRINITY_DN6441_c0_g1_i6:131-484(-)